ncbi:MAG: photosynthetic protein synthase [Myxococcales bacterium]|nr:photosynthetic protein synthase [Myxococcales bacterium]
MKRALLIALLIVVVGSTAAIAMLKARRPPLPRYGAVPAFALTDSAGKPFGSSDLDGRPYVIDFIFTTCPEICPRMTEEMSKLQTWIVNRGLDNRVRLISVSIDPDRDTPDKLRTYAHQFHARPGTWTFVTGSQKTIEDAVVKGFKIAVSREKDDSEDSFAIVHGTKFVLVDAKREIRGYYDSADGESLARLRGDVTTLAEGGE